MMIRKKWSDEKLLHRALINKTEAGYWGNIHELRLRPSQLLFIKCIELIHSANPKEKILGIDILAQLGSPERHFLGLTLKIYFELLEKETDLLVIKAILFGISHNNSNLTEAQKTKIFSLNYIHHDVIKDGLISTLGFMNDMRAIEILIILSEDHLIHRRDWATFYIAESKYNNKKVREALWRRVKDRHYNTKLATIIGLARRKDIRIIEIIKNELKNDRSTAGLFDAILDLKYPQFLLLLKIELEKANQLQDISSYWKNSLDRCMISLEKINNKVF